MRGPLNPGRPCYPIADRRNPTPCPAQPRKNVLALTHHRNVRSELTQGCHRCRRTMWPDRNDTAAVTGDSADYLLRRTKLGGSASPEEITRGGAYNGEVRSELSNLLCDLVKAEIAQLPIDQLNLVAGHLKQRPGIAKLQRK